MVSSKQIAFFAAVVGLVALYLTYSSTMASIDYWLSIGNQQIYPNTPAQAVIINFKNGGGSDGNINLSVKFINATFSNETEKPYTIINPQQVTFFYLLHKGDSGIRVVFFNVNNGVSGFSIELSAEKPSTIEMSKYNPMYPTILTYKWSEKENAFKLIK
jgi:hypothetical protein